MIVDWKKAKAAVPWCPFEEFPFPLVPLTDHLFRIDSTAYAFVVPHNRHCVQDARAPYVTMVLWAPSTGAALRAMHMQIEQDGGECSAPPPDLLLPGAEPVYGSLLHAARQLDRHGTLESASYRVATDGAFIDRTIRVVGFTFHFRSNENDVREAPYSISYRGGRERHFRIA